MVFIVGPTASGKHEIAAEVALKFSLEIVSIDAYKVYKHMDIGTAKPSKEILSKVKHHLISTIEPSESYSVGRFLDDASEILQGKGRFLGVGGTFLYYKALVYGMFKAPSSDPARRNELLAKDPQALHEELKKIDPATASRLHANDKKRVARAIEVFKLTGKPISQLQTHFKNKVEAKSVCIVWDREELKKRAADRIDKMLKAGLLDEVKKLKSMTLSYEAQNAICYKEFFDYLDNKCTLEEAKATAIKRTNEFTRRQMTWIRSLPELQSIDATNLKAAQLVEKTVSILR